MGRIKVPELFLLTFQLYTDNSQEKGQNEIQVAIARKILEAVWHMITKEEDFIDYLPEKVEELKSTKERIRQFESCMAQ